MKDRIITLLVGGLLAIAMLWVTSATGTVTRSEMQEYVDVTATEHLRLLRDDLRNVQEVLMSVRERLSGVETILRLERN